jgi:predicted Zn-dependent protease
VFSDTAAQPRCQIDRLQFSLSVSTVSRQNFKFGFIVSTPESCASKVSRASGICTAFRQMRRTAVDKPVDGLVQIRIRQNRAI